MYEIIEIVAVGGIVALGTYIGAKYGTAIFEKAIGVASEVEGLVKEVETAFPGETKNGIYVSAKKFIDDFKDMVADGKIDFWEARRQYRDGVAVKNDLLDLYANLTASA